MSSQSQSVKQLLKTFPKRPFDQKELGEKLATEIRKFQNKASPENVKSQWELVLRSEVFALAVRSIIATLQLTSINPTVCIGNRGWGFAEE